MVIAARFLEKDIVTIREAAWLTDKTYKYEQIVMQMGKILSTVRGNLIDINHHHIMKIMVEQMDLNRSERDLFMFMGDHLMLNMPLGLYSPYLLATTAWICTTAASDVTTHIWGPALELWTGQNLHTLAPAIAVCYADCINGLDRPVMDNRKQELKSVMQRYNIGDDVEKFCFPEPRFQNDGPVMDILKPFLPNTKPVLRNVNVVQGSKVGVMVKRDQPHVAAAAGLSSLSLDCSNE